MTDEIASAIDDGQQQEPAFSMDRDSALAHIAKLERFPLRKRICICGHTITAHQYDATFGYVCKPGQVWCQCARPVAVYCASDARFFMRSTHGLGYKHALGLAIASLEKKGGYGEWMVEIKCQVNDCSNLEITVACVDEASKVLDRSTPYSVFLCREHAFEMGAGLLAT